MLELDAIDKASIPLFMLTMLGEWWLLRDRPRRTLGDMSDATPEQLSGAQLPPDDRGLELIMVGIAQGGLNQAVISIEQASEQLAHALEAMPDS